MELEPMEIVRWLTFRFNEWAILFYRDGEHETFVSYLERMDGKAAVQLPIIRNLT